MASIFNRRALLALFIIALLVLGGEAATKKKKKTKKVKAVAAPVVKGLTTSFYKGKCDNYSSVVLKHVTAAMRTNPTIAAGLLRMHFHDCWIRGCDASVLLDSTDGSLPEKQAGPNLSLRGFEVINNIKKELESKCKGVVSCADILTSAARDAVALAGGPSWDVPLGRKDGRVSRASEVTLPGPFDSVSSLISSFSAKQLSVTDLVALSGAHTIGFGNCAFFQSRLTNDPTMNATYARQLSRTCNANSNANAPNDPVTRDRFDNKYYSNLQQRKGLFSSDEGLFFDSRTRTLVNTFAGNSQEFSKQFKASMTKLITLPPFQSTSGGIRSVCNIAK